MAVRTHFIERRFFALFIPSTRHSHQKNNEMSVKKAISLGKRI